MTGVPQVIVTIDPRGNLVAELPGFQATRRKVELSKGKAEDTLRRILEGQLLAGMEIGLDGAPTARQVQHWEKHQEWPKEGCRWCVEEGRIGRGISSARRKEFVSDGTVQIKRLKPRESGLPKKQKAKPQRAMIVLKAKTHKTAEELGL